MTYHVRNPYAKKLRQESREQRDLQQHQEQEDEATGGNFLQWTFLLNGRVSNSKDNKSTQYIQDEDGNLTLVQKDEAAFMSLATPNTSIVTFSSREPNYPIGYSCKHTLLYPERNSIEDTIAMLSYSEDNKDSKTLNETPVRISLEFELSSDEAGDYSKVNSNVEALQWSVLKTIAGRTGLSKGCNINAQYDEKTLVTALTNINNIHSAQKKEDRTSNDVLPPSNNENENDNHENKNSRKKYRWLARDLGTNRRLLSSLPYPTGVFSIDSTRPRWTASCSDQSTDDKETTSQCFTTEINFDVKYRGSVGESNLVEEYLQSMVHNQVVLDAKQLFAEDITGLRWISNDDSSSIFDGSNSDQGTLTPIFFGPDGSLPRDPREDDALGGNNATTPNKETSNADVASVVIPLATALILGLFWCCFHKNYMRKQNKRKNRNKKKQHSHSGTTGTNKQQDIETGSVSTETSQVTRELLSKISSDSQDTHEVKACTEVKTCTHVIAEALGLSSSSSVLLAGSSPTKSTGSNKSTKSGPVLVDSSERSAAGLPPRPMPVKREGSKQLKKRRKRKKKKNHQVLALRRVSSRDNVTELPMISESESECDSEYTSDDEDEDYSHCDDESSYDASAGCRTPSRSSSQRSHSSSRASSPQKSPRDDELFPAEPMDSRNYEFVIEAPEFSEDLFAEEGKKEKSDIFILDEDPPRKVALQPRMKFEPIEAKSVLVEDNKQVEAVPRAGDEKEIGILEIDASTELDTSFVEENGSVMERMLPLPWLTGSRNHHIMR
mmetsp:Transcript_114324/g.233834  ORF Transcript_114324/g.233834 Transcript_114324/m.233834 type:complete len:780 (-) Transcript_114324:306-2645(-)